MTHFVETRRDEPRQADHIDFPLARDIENLGRRNHDAKVDHFIVVALKHNAHDIFSDVVNVALYRRHEDRRGGFFLGSARAPLFFFHERHQIGDRLLHDAGALHHLRQKHLAIAEKVADHVHAVHQRAFDDMKRTFGLLARFFHILLDIGIDAFHERMRQALADAFLTP